MHITITLTKKDYTTLLLQGGQRGFKRLIFLYCSMIVILIFFGLGENAGALEGVGLPLALLYVTLATGVAFLFMRFVAPRIMAFFEYIREKSICENTFMYEFGEKSYSRNYRQESKHFEYSKVARYWVKDDAYYIASSPRTVDIFPKRLLDETQDAYIYNLLKRECAKIDKENASKSKRKKEKSK